MSVSRLLVHGKTIVQSGGNIHRAVILRQFGGLSAFVQADSINPQRGRIRLPAPVSPGEAREEVRILLNAERAVKTLPGCGDGGMSGRDVPAVVALRDHGAAKMERPVAPGVPRKSVCLSFAQKDPDSGKFDGIRIRIVDPEALPAMNPLFRIGLRRTEILVLPGKTDDGPVVAPQLKTAVPDLRRRGQCRQNSGQNSCGKKIFFMQLPVFLLRPIRIIAAVAIDNDSKPPDEQIIGIGVVAESFLKNMSVHR